MIVTVFASGRVVLALPLLAALTGCVGVAAEGANIVRDRAIVAEYTEAAQAGDAEAQYRVGDALCCSVNEGQGFYDTRLSVAWLCRSAEQGYGPAALKLGEIYSGDVVSGVRVMRRVAQRVAGSSTNPAVAYAWFARAGALGVAEAAEPAASLWEDLSEDQRAAATALVTGGDLPCEWDEVIS